MPVPASSPTTDETGSARWENAAACAGLPPRIVFARRLTDARPALEACAVCPVRCECEQTVAPADSWFDGVSAGRLWRNGRPVAQSSDVTDSPAA
jgi:WhiB family redox-sensing transcriptional regulator